MAPFYKSAETWLSSLGIALLALSLVLVPSGRARADDPCGESACTDGQICVDGTCVALTCVAACDTGCERDANGNCTANTNCRGATGCNVCNCNICTSDNGTSSCGCRCADGIYRRGCRQDPEHPSEPNICTAYAS